jgi:hypothetical protein
LNNGERLTSDESLNKPSREHIRETVLIAPPSTPVLDKRVSYFATVTIEHHPGTRLAEYDREQTSVMNELEINNSRQEDPSGDAEARPSSASSVIDLNGLLGERSWQTRDPFQNWVASTVNIAHPTCGEKSQQVNH